MVSEGVMMVVLVSNDGRSEVEIDNRFANGKAETGVAAFSRRVSLYRKVTMLSRHQISKNHLCISLLCNRSLISAPGSFTDDAFAALSA